MKNGSGDERSRQHLSQLLLEDAHKRYVANVLMAFYVSHTARRTTEAYIRKLDTPQSTKPFKAP